MNRIIRLASLSMVFVVVIFAAPAVINAQSDPDNRPGSQARDAAQSRQADRQEKREAMRASIEERVQSRRAEVRVDVCERRQDQLAQLIPRLANQSARLNGVIDDIYARVQGFYESGQLTVEDYDVLNTNVAAAQAEAATAVEVAASYEFELDCDNPSVGDQLVGFRESVADARGALKAYRVELVTLISSLRAEAAEVENENTETNTEEELNTEEGGNSDE